MCILKTFIFTLHKYTRAFLIKFFISLSYSISLTCNIPKQRSPVEIEPETFNMRFFPFEIKEFNLPIALADHILVV